MTILIGQHEFDGPVTSFADIPVTPGLYALLYKDKGGFMLVDIDQSENLSRTLTQAYVTLGDKTIVILQCLNPYRRKAILSELVSEFDFEGEEPMQKAPTKKRIETNSGIALSI